MRKWRWLCISLALLALSACRKETARQETPREGAPVASAAPSASAPARGDPRFDAELSASAYAFPVRHFELRTQRQVLRMAYMDVRPASPNGRSVLLLHGKNFSGAYWASTVRLLTERGFHVVVPDQVGFGKSSKPERYQFSFQALAENTRALLASLGVERTVVVGHSMGGMLATRFALTFPELTEKLVLVAPIGLEDWKRKVPPRSVDAWYAAELETTPESIRAYQRKSYYGGEWKPEYEQLIELSAGMTRHPDYPKVAWCSALLYDMIFTQPVLYEFGDLRVPTLLIVGLRDRTAVGSGWAPPAVAATLGDYTVLGKRARDAIPNAELVELEGVGHMPQVEAFERYSAALLAFLR